MSDTQRDREERQRVIEILQKEKKTALHDNKWAFDYAIASIKTDFKYDLLYEETSGQADKQADKITTKKDLAVDAISRQAINGYIDYILNHGMGKRKSFEFIKKFVDNLPPVTPQPKTGHWDDIPKYKDIAWQCSECGHFTTMKHNFCPDCGCAMVEPQESEVERCI